MDEPNGWLAADRFCDGLSLFIHDDAHKYTGAYFELADHKYVAGTPVVVNTNVHVIQIILRMADEPGAWWNPSA